MSNLEKIIRQAIQTFSKVQSQAKFQENLNSLNQNTSKLTLDDVYLDKKFVFTQDHSTQANPVIYIPVFEDANILVSIFILKSNSVIPLHDHPLMFGILKVLCGSVRIESYNGPSENIKYHQSECSPNNYYYVEDSLYRDTIVVHKNPSVILNEADSSVLLTPFKNNIHEVRSFNGPAAFIDILAPPYGSIIKDNGPRKCRYFTVADCVNNKCLLEILWRHPPYWTVEMAFPGPKIQVEE